MKDGTEFELRSQSGSQFHPLSEEASNTQGPVTRVKDSCFVITGKEEECWNFVVVEGRDV